MPIYIGAKKYFYGKVMAHCHRFGYNPPPPKAAREKSFGTEIDYIFGNNPNTPSPKKQRTRIVYSSLPPLYIREIVWAKTGGLEKSLPPQTG